MDSNVFESSLMRLDYFFQDASTWLSKLFTRSDTALRAVSYTRALLTSIERKNSWQMAEAVGLETPYAFQHLLGRATWDPDAIRDELISHVKESLGTNKVVLALDETGFVKKGKSSAGVARQYSGTAGRIENCQIGVFLGYSTERGHTLIDRELYLPKEWADDPERLATVGIEPVEKFQTKIQLARKMLEKAFAQGVKADWVVADSVYGNDSKLRFWLEERCQNYALAVLSNQHVSVSFYRITIKQAFKTTLSEAWQRLSLGTGSKGQRLYDFTALELPHPYTSKVKRWAVCRRSIDDPTEMSYYLAFTEEEGTLQSIVDAIGKRWTIEECFETSKGQVGLDQYEVRSAVGWYRHMTLAMVAQYILIAARNQFFPRASTKQVAMADFKKKRGLVSL